MRFKASFVIRKHKLGHFSMAFVKHSHLICKTAISQIFNFYRPTQKSTEFKSCRITELLEKSTVDCIRTIFTQSSQIWHYLRFCYLKLKMNCYQSQY